MRILILFLTLVLCYGCTSSPTKPGEEPKPIFELSEEDKQRLEYIKDLSVLVAQEKIYKEIIDDLSKLEPAKLTAQISDLELKTEIDYKVAELLSFDWVRNKPIFKAIIESLAEHSDRYHNIIQNYGN